MDYYLYLMFEEVLESLFGLHNSLLCTRRPGAHVVMVPSVSGDERTQLYLGTFWCMHLHNNEENMFFLEPC